MFFNNRMRPAFATAGACNNTPVRCKNHKDALMLDANSAADDFGNFSNAQTHEKAPRRERPAMPQKQPKKKQPFNKLWILAIVAVVAVVLIGILVVSAIRNSAKDIQYTDNTYLAYLEETGTYRVAVNGKVLEQTFEGETRVIPSLDRSFAYIECNSADGYLIYLVKGKKVTAITTEDYEISEVLGYAENEPGVLYREEGNVYIYNEELGEDLIDKNVDAANFIISGDASTVIYTRPLEDSAGEYRIYMYRDGSSAPIGVKNCKPLKVSKNGEYVYGEGSPDGIISKLFCITTKDGERYPVCDTNFGAITAMNAAGNEIIYYSLSEDAKITAYIYSANKNENFEIAKGKGAFFPATVDPDVARCGTFADCYLQSISLSGMLTDGENTTSGYTYYVNKKFETQQIANALGQFSPDEKYFYYVNSKNSLYQVDLNDLDKAPKKIYEDTADFAITQKGNIYMLGDEGLLYFYKASTGKKTPISKFAEDISMHHYGNKLYFVNEGEEGKVYVTEEGSAKELAKFDKVELPTLPEFNSTYSKKSFAYFYDEAAGCSLFYTANGKSFKLVTSDCEAIETNDVPAWLSDLYDSLVGGLG